MNTCVFLLWAAIAGHLPSAVPLTIAPLDGLNWTLRNETTKVTGRVPGGVYSDLMLAGLLPDGDYYYRYNDVGYRWVAMGNWTYSTVVDAATARSLTAEPSVYLQMDGVDTVADVRVNGHTVGSTDNMFASYFFDVTRETKTAENISIEVLLQSPVRWAAAAFAAQSAEYVVPPECVPEEYRGECHANHIRKMQSSFSWDWGPAFPSMGIWKPLRIVAFSSAYLTGLVLNYDSQDEFPSLPDTTFLPSWNVQIKVMLRVADSKVETHGNVSVVIGDHLLSINEAVTLQPKEEEEAVEVVLSLPVPRDTVHLWWPTGYGGHPLYNLTVTWHGDGEDSAKTAKIGFRKVQLDQSFIDPNNESLGRHYRLFVNSVRIFLRGSNWIPAHALPELVTREYTRRLLQDAVGSNQNSLRVWGGGIYETDYFYEVADELGLLIWQDLMFACSMYPVNEDFLASVQLEVATQVARLNTHPSIVLWAGNNENEAALVGNWYGTATNFDQYKSDYVTLYVDTLRARVLELNPSREFVVSSPSNGLESEQEGYLAEHPYSNIYGDVHYYNYASDAWNWTTYPRTRLASEYGFQSWPGFRTMKEVTNASDWFISSAMMDHRQHHPFGNTELTNQILRHMLYPDNADHLTNYKNYLYLGQVHQAMAIRTESEVYRRLQSSVSETGEGYTAGALYWQLNDVWQGASWSSIEFGGRWKLLHYYVRDFFSPVIVSPFVDGSRIKVFTVNDLPRSVANVTLSLELHSFLQFECLATEVVTNITLPAQAAQQVLNKDMLDDLSIPALCHHPLYDPTDVCFLTFAARGAEGATVAPPTFLLLGEPKDAPLRKANVMVDDVTGPSADGLTYQIDLSSDHVALFVLLETDIDGVFSSNGFIMTAPTMTLEFSARQSTSAAELLGAVEVRCLTDTYDTKDAWKRYWRQKRRGNRGY